jgi:hypothetical protein
MWRLLSIGIDMQHDANVTIDGRIGEIVAKCRLREFEELKVTLYNVDTRYPLHEQYLSEIFQGVEGIDIVVFKESVLSHERGPGSWLSLLFGNRCLVDLRISASCTMYKLFVRDLVDGLKRNTTIQTLMFGGWSRRFDKKALSNVLASHTSIKSLGVGGITVLPKHTGVNNVRTNIFTSKEILKIVQKNPVIENLFIQGVAFKNRELESLAQNTSLRKLSMTYVEGVMKWNDFVEVITRIIIYNKKLESLILLDNSLPFPCPDIEISGEMDYRHRLVTKLNLLNRLKCTCRRRQLRLEMLPQIQLAGSHISSQVILDNRLASRVGLDMDMSTVGTHGDHLLMHSLWLSWSEKEGAVMMALHSRLGAGSLLGRISDDVMRRIFTHHL